jgi:hypothetical protein
VNIVGNFVKDAKVTDGLLVALRNGYLLWAGPVTKTPLDSFPEGTDLHVHPALYDRIETTAAATGEGIPHDPQASS